MGRQAGRVKRKELTPFCTGYKIGDERSCIFSLFLFLRKFLENISLGLAAY